MVVFSSFRFQAFLIMQLKKFVCHSILLFSIFLNWGCATYYKQHQLFNEKFYSGDVEQANQILDNNKKDQRNKNKVLYYLNKGTLLWMMQNYDQSSKFFLLADHYIEDQGRNLGASALSLITNPTVKPYKPEDFESVLIHFYQTLNFLHMNNMQEALVECRRMNEKLYLLNDKYKSNQKNRYNDDAFAHVLMGLIYEATGDTNNAFIAYRNAYNIYQDNYTKNFDTPAPDQLKRDILRTAKLTGLDDQYNQYKKIFQCSYNAPSPDQGEIIFFWMNGLGPIKSEWSINFTTLSKGDGLLTLANEGENMNFPLPLSSLSTQKQTALKDLDFLRIAFPKYMERRPIYSQANIWINDSLQQPMERAENINAIAFKTLKDRMIREMANSILRLATKKAMENYARSKNDNLGTLLSIANALTEKADTRNWQTLPHSIYYTRIRLPQGTHRIKLSLQSPSGLQQQQQEFTFNVKKGETQFFSFHNLESQLPSNR